MRSVLLLRVRSSGAAFEGTVLCQVAVKVIEIETIGSYLEYRFRTTEGICL
jgi:hypothetical protein